MDAVDHRTGRGLGRPGVPEPEARGLVDGVALVEVTLIGGAPWGFTLKGGLEHREPLLITKIEEGSKATGRLQAGDEIVSINEVSLTGYRQEAICLVKSSHKTLTLVVKRTMKVVDIVAQKMPSESDVHVARSFLTKILRSSMRRNEPVSRPHSWHSTKYTEGQTDATKAALASSAVWHSRYDGSSLSHDLSSSWDQTNLRRVSDQFSSLGSMDSLDHSSQPYERGRLSPAKSNNSIDHLGGSGGGSSNKRDSAYSSFSTSSSTPDHTLSKSNATSTENMLSKVGPWDGGRMGNQRQSQNLNENSRLDEKQSCLLLPSGNGDRESPRSVEQPGSRQSGSGRSSFGPVWHIPEKKRNASSPPPPPPPVRSDSFAATKVHEKSLMPPYSEGTPFHKSPLWMANCTSAESSDPQQRAARRSHNQVVPPFVSVDSYNNNQVTSNRLHSLSSIDIRVGQTAQHQRQYSDESTLYSFARPSAVAPKPQGMCGYYSSMQELPTNLNQYYNESQVRTTGDSTGHPRYYCVTARQSAQASLVKVENWKGSTGTDLGQDSSEKNPWPKHTLPPPPPPPPLQQSYVEAAADRGHYRPEDKEGGTQGLGPDGDEWGGQKRGNGFLPHHLADAHQQPDDLPDAGGAPPRGQCRGEDAKICPQKTPMLHSLAQETFHFPEKCNEPGRQDVVDHPANKQQRRSDRYATTLRNEIQMRRAKLQKSKSTAALSDPSEAEEDQESWKADPVETPTSTSDGSFSHSYKDHLKEAQARVLRATSFRRRDLEPVLLEYPPDVPENLVGQPASLPLKDNSGQCVFTETSQSKLNPPVTRIGGRKRFSAEQKVRSYSEPDKINEVGTGGAEAGKFRQPGNPTSFADRRKFFEASSKPTFLKPAARQAQRSSLGGHSLQKPHLTEAEEAWQERRTRAASFGFERSLRSLEEDGEIPANISRRNGERCGSLEQQRLGTFAEYEATWNEQRKPSEVRSSGRYHSADNILDSGAEEIGKAQCVHERSRSSPSADFYGQNVLVPATKKRPEDTPADGSRPGAPGAETDTSSVRLSEESSRERPPKDKQLAAEGRHRPSQPEPPLWGLPDNRGRSVTLPNDYRYKEDDEAAARAHIADPLQLVPPLSESRALIDSGAGTLPETPALGVKQKKKGAAPQRPPPPKLDKYKRQEGSSSTTDCQESGGARQSSTPSSDALAAALSRVSLGDVKSDEGKWDASEKGLPASATRCHLHLKSSMEVSRSPSPQFSPQRLTDKPPVSVNEEAPSRIEKVMDNNTTVKMVPIKIVHSESHAEKESRPYLVQRPEPTSVPGDDKDQIKTLTSMEQSYSRFCAYTRQGTDQEQWAQDDEPRGKAEHPSDAKTADDLKTEELAREIVGKDKSLADILDPNTKMKTTMDLMEGIFPKDEQLLEEAQQRRRVPPKQQSPKPSERRSEEASPSAAALTTSSSYYNTSAPKAELLIKMKDMQEQNEEEDSEEELDYDLSEKKHELIDSISKKLQVLRDARESLQEDIQANNELGEEVEAKVKQVCKANEFDKFRMFIGDLDKVVSLLLSLSGRLARVENALNNLDEAASAEEKRTLIDKRKLLITQHEDAKELKENLDRRERAVYDILASHLNEEDLADYEHFVKMKSALIIEQRKLEDKIKLGDEQLKCLTDSLTSEARMKGLAAF
ncbi:protein Shroom2 isoform X2 [Erpetoichthys calabaricus]|uniref:protein Shroom2 isoform X2 n=1 Tax=Erpetoichthys calabaricus TaxID=27687 RepID=UPI00109F14FC|nr:protein Shroom2 isoform X2 [Erpetoichthys calabaricus]